MDNIQSDEQASKIEDYEAKLEFERCQLRQKADLAKPFLLKWLDGSNVQYESIVYALDAKAAETAFAYANPAWKIVGVHAR